MEKQHVRKDVEATTQEVSEMAEQLRQPPQDAAIAPYSERDFEYIDVLGQQVALSVEVVRQLICPAATPFEALSFLHTARALGANPFLRQIFLVKYSKDAPASIIVSRDFYLHIAASNPQFLGMESGTLCVKPRRSPLYEEVTREIKGLYEALSSAKDELPDALKQHAQVTRERLNKLLAGGDEYDVVEVPGEVVPPGMKLFGGWARVYIKDDRLPEGKRVVEARVMLSEYDRGQALWKQCPATMITKVAEAHALRKAFPLRFAGAYISEEIGESSEL